MLVRRFEADDAGVSYEIQGYTGDVASTPSPMLLPEAVPEVVVLLTDALRHGAGLAGRPVEAFVDVTEGRSVEVDLTSALRSGRVEPLRLGMPAEEVEALLGFPEAISPLAEGEVAWFYGSAQLHLAGRRLSRLEIDRGLADFTSLRFTGWFLSRQMTIEEVASALDARAVSHRRVTRYGLPMLEIGGNEEALFLIDFDPDKGTLHALYWMSV